MGLAWLTSATAVSVPVASSNLPVPPVSVWKISPLDIPFPSGVFQPVNRVKNWSPFAAVKTAVPSIAKGGGVPKFTVALATNVLAPR